MKIALITILWSLLSSVTWASVVEGKSWVSQVTVFKDRAFVRRERLIELKPGNYSVKFSEVTPILNRDSLRGFVGKDGDVQLLGIRSEDEYKIKEEHPKLKVLYKEKESLDKQVKELIDRIDGVINEDKDLRELLQHYDDSFTVNLHSDKWDKKTFLGFVELLKERTKGMHGKWKNAYLKLLELYQKMEFVRAQIQELSTVSDNQVVNVYVDVVVKSAKKYKIEIQYLVSNCSWSPVYDLRIKGAEGKAEFEQYAYVTQNTGEDWNKVKMELSNNREELKPIVPSISSYTLTYREVEKVKTSVKSKQDEGEALTVGIEPQEEIVEGLAKKFEIKGLQSIKSGMPKSKIFVAKALMDYREHLEIVAKQYPYVYRKGELDNVFAWRLAEGPASIYYDGEFVQDFWLESVAKKDKIYINAGVDHSIVVNYFVNEKTSVEGILKNKTKYTKELITSLKSYSRNKKKVRVLEQLPISELDEIEVKTDGSSLGFKTLEGKPSWVFWDVELNGREDQIRKLNISVITPKDYGFSW